MNRSFKLALLLALIAVSLQTKSQTKSGILKKDYYGVFTADDWEVFLQGKDAARFEAKANITLPNYLAITKNFVTENLKESSIESAVQNSTVKEFPAGAKVYTHSIDNNGKMVWFTRDAYPGEKGLYHTATGLYWLSFQCGNLTAFGSGPTNPSGATLASYTGPGKLENTAASGMTNTLTFTGSNQDTWESGYAKFLAGSSMRQNDFIVDAALYKMIQDSKQCCGAQTNGAFVSSMGTTSAVTSVVAAQPSSVVYPQSAQLAARQSVPFGQTFGGQVLANLIGGYGAEVLGGMTLHAIYPQSNVVTTTNGTPFIPIGTTGIPVDPPNGFTSIAGGGTGFHFN